MDTYIRQHGRLGDMILCNGLVRHLLESKNKRNKIYIFCRSSHLKSVKFMYRDEKKIKIVWHKNKSPSSHRSFRC